MSIWRVLLARVLGRRLFITVPFKLTVTENKEEIVSKRCEDCVKKAEALGMETEDICPDLDCNEETEVNVDKVIMREDNFEISRISDFFQITDNETLISFTDGSFKVYSITSGDLKTKLKNHLIFI